MASGRPENELTVTIQYPNGRMRVHIHEVLARTGKRIRVDRPEDHNPYEGGVKPKYVMDYSIKDCRRLFGFMVRWLDQDILEQVDQFIKDNNDKLYKEWIKQRELGGR